MVVKLKENNLVYYYVKCTWNEKQYGILVDPWEVMRTLAELNRIHELKIYLIQVC